MDPIKLQKRREKKRKEQEKARIRAEKAQKRVKSLTITINWHKSYMWGNCPRAEVRVYFKDGTQTNRDGYKAGGCGYDKESTVIADIFNDFLKYKIHRKRSGTPPYGIYTKQGEPSGRSWVSYNGGVGTSCYYAISDFIGGRFEKTASGKTWDQYTYTDKRAAGRKLPAESDPFGPVKGLMALGAIMADTQEQKNRNAKAALSTQPGITFPEDWDQLPEETKTKRLKEIKAIL